MIPTQDIVVGDIALLEPGEIVPVDGIFLQGHNIVCDEAGATGESHTIKKLTYEDASQHTMEHLEKIKSDCFLISGSKVLEGVGSYLVIAIGPRSFNGKIMMGMCSDVTPDH